MGAMPRTMTVRSAAEIVKKVPLGTCRPPEVMTLVLAQALRVSAVAPGSRVIAPSKAMYDRSSDARSCTVKPPLPQLTAAIGMSHSTQRT